MHEYGEAAAGFLSCGWEVEKEKFGELRLLLFVSLVLGRPLL